MNRILALLLCLLCAVPARAQNESITPFELWAPGQQPNDEDCPTFKGNKFLWQATCGGSFGQVPCHTHVCVNRLCFAPRVCATPGFYQIGSGSNGDAICAAFPTSSPVLSATPTTSPTATPTVTLTPTTTPTPTLTLTPTVTVTGTPEVPAPVGQVTEEPGISQIPARADHKHRVDIPFRIGTPSPTPSPTSTQTITPTAPFLTPTTTATITGPTATPTRTATALGATATPTTTATPTSSPVLIIQNGKFTVDRFGFTNAKGLNAGFSQNGRDLAAIFTGFRVPRSPDLTATRFYDYQDEFFYLDQQIPSLVLEMVPQPATSRTLWNTIFHDDSGSIAWTANTNPYPIVITIDLGGGAVTAKGNGAYTVGLTFRSSAPVGPTNPTSISIETWNNTTKRWDAKTLDTGLNLDSASAEGYVTNQFVTNDTNVWGVRIILDGVNPIPAQLALQRVILYHQTAAWDPWHISVGGRATSDATFYGPVRDLPLSTPGVTCATPVPGLTPIPQSQLGGRYYDVEAKEQCVCTDASGSPKWCRQSDRIACVGGSTTDCFGGVATATPTPTQTPTVTVTPTPAPTATGCAAHPELLCINGRTGTTNNPTISSDAGGTIRGSGTTGFSFKLVSDNGTAHWSLQRNGLGIDRLILGPGNDPTTALVSGGVLGFAVTSDTEGAFFGAYYAGDTGQGATFFGIRAGGNFATPTETLDNQQFLNIYALGFDSTNSFTGSPSGTITFQQDGAAGIGIIPGTILMGTQDSTGAFGFHFTIRADGTVGIGTTTPVAKLDIAGTTFLQDAVFFGGAIPTCGTGCSSFTTESNDRNMVIIVSGGVVTAVTVNFSTTLATAPYCVANAVLTGVPIPVVQTARSTTATTFTTSATVGGGNIIAHCFEVL